MKLKGFFRSPEIYFWGVHHAIRITAERGEKEWIRGYCFCIRGKQNRKGLEI
jgi:hypothetical protein